MTRTGMLAFSVLVIVGWCAPGSAAAETHNYIIAIGNNERPDGAKAGADEGVEALRYADDDAASMVSFWRELGADAELLTVFDTDSQQRFPALSRTARPPTLAALREVVADLRKRFEADRGAGNDPVLVFYYSGHGSVKAGEDPSLAMVDGPLTRKVLYDEVLAALPARYVHLIVDACHAEAVVRPRDLQAEVAPVADSELEEYATRNTLRRFPHVGAVVATSAIAEAHEWDEYQRGVFTFQVLSALRGAADVNRDGLIEYSELSAFLGSANASVVDPRAKLSVVTRPPPVNPHAPIADLSMVRARGATLTGVGPAVGRFFVEDERGNRLGEFRPEAGYRFALSIPSGEQLWVRTSTSEGSFRAEPGARVALGSLSFASRLTRARGAVESSLRHGLFATAFGPTYYRGYVDARAELPAVDVPSDSRGSEPDLDAPPRLGWPATRVAGLTLAGVGVVGLAIGTAYGLELMSKNDEIDRTCASGMVCSLADRAKYNNDVADARTARALSVVGFAVGGAALVIGGVLAFWGSTGRTGNSLSLRASVGSDGAGATIGGTW